MNLIDFFTKIYPSTSIKEKSILNTLRVYSAIRYAVRNVANFILPIYIEATKKNRRYRIETKNGNNNPKLIVSLTSFPARIKNVHLVIESILRQTHKPDKIILWLSKKQFSEINVLPKKLLDLRNRGLTISLEEEDLKSHKKYYYTINKFINEILITIDDDILYPSNMIEKLVYSHEQYPTSIIARYGSKITHSSQQIDLYNQWQERYVNYKPDFLAFFGSGGGTLFPPESFHSITLEKDLFLNLTPTADDIWLNAMVRLNGKKILIQDSNNDILFPILNSGNATLAEINNGDSQNDIQLKNLREYFINYHGVDPFKNIFD